jgi:hypothetical protein
MRVRALMSSLKRKLFESMWKLLFSSTYVRGLLKREVERLIKYDNARVLVVYGPHRERELALRLYNAGWRAKHRVRASETALRNTDLLLSSKFGTRVRLGKLLAADGFQLLGFEGSFDAQVLNEREVEALALSPAGHSCRYRDGGEQLAT